MKTITIILLLALGLDINAQTELDINAQTENQKNSKKLVLALYHGVRTTREFDGSSKLWTLAAESKVTRGKNKAFAWNADVIGDNGSRSPASVFGEPVIGIQSEYDPDYHEYQILLAKTAGIDGFMVDFAFRGQGLDDMRLIMQKTAAKYDFKLGLDWYDSKCFSWIKNKKYAKLYPEVATRPQQMEAMRGNLEYLMKALYSTPAGLNWNGHPLIMLFGGGVNTAEIKALETSLPLPNTLKSPYFLRRFVPNVTVKDEKYDFDDYQLADWKWKDYIAGPFNWVTPRVREFPDGQTYDVHATEDDCLRDLNLYLNGLNKLESQDKIKFRMLTLFPGMDNRGCYGWGRELAFIPRNKGSLFSKSWQLALNKKDSMDAVLIATWNDFTEGHQLEPTEQAGFRELETCMNYAFKFKGDHSEVDETNLRLPEQLFELRKKAKFFNHVGLNITEVNKVLDQAGLKISSRNYEEAKRLLKDATARATALETTVGSDELVVTFPSGDTNILKPDMDGCFDLSKQPIVVKLSKALSLRLQQNFFTGYVSFEYLDKGTVPDSIMNIYTTPGKDAKSRPSICSIGSNNTGEWISAKVMTYKPKMNWVDLDDSSVAFYFSGKAKVKNINLNFKIYDNVQSTEAEAGKPSEKSWCTQLWEFFFGVEE